MRRREFNAILAGAAAFSMAGPLTAHAQQAVMPVVGFLGFGSEDTRVRQVSAFHQGLKAGGYVQGQNVAIEYRWARGRSERLAPLAAELVQLRVDVIAAFGDVAVMATKGTGTAIPIVFLEAIDPVQRGLVASLNRPGGNMTGVLTLNVELGQKRLEALRQLVPAAGRFAVLVNPANRGNTETTLQDMNSAAQTLGVKLDVVEASTDADIDKVFAELSRSRPGGLVIGTDGFFLSRGERMATLALRHKLPAIFQYREFVAAGGLMSYGTNIADTYRQIGIYVGRILKGAKPGDLPVQQSSTVELIINQKTAKALGLAIPLPLLGRADEVIE